MSLDRSQLVVMARWPAPLRCKRRLAAGVGPVQAAAVQARLTSHVLQESLIACRSSVRGSGRPELVLAVSGLGSRAAARWGRSLGADRTVLQGTGSLGLRLRRQVRRVLREGAASLLLIGTDLPELTAADLRQAWCLLQRRPLVLGPARDGGYWLIGLRDDWPVLFAGQGGAIPWGSDQVLRRTLAAAGAAGLQPACLPDRSDLDHPQDLRRWR
ncbi:MAG: TIGR04282 family arsenosugar biosynthesis glycosyltransferase [Cyanobium sp.]